MSVDSHAFHDRNVSAHHVMHAISTPTQFVSVATQIFAGLNFTVCEQTSKTAKIMCLENLALYGS